MKTPKKKKADQASELKRLERQLSRLKRIENNMKLNMLVRGIVRNMSME